MQKELITMPEIKLVGICVRTSNQQELDKIKGNIFPCVQKYFHQGLAEKISNRKRPGTTFCGNFSISHGRRLPSQAQATAYHDLLS